MGRWECGVCKQVPGRKFEFHSKISLQRHVKNFHEASSFPCRECSESFQNRYHLLSHIKSAHHKKRLEKLRRDFSFDLLDEFEEKPASTSCPFCSESFSSPHQLRGHWRREHRAETGNAEFSKATSDEERLAFIQDKLLRHPELFILPLVKESSSENPKFKLAQHNYTLSFNELGLEAVKMAFGSELIARVFTHVVDELKRQCEVKEKSFIGFNITADSLDTPLKIPFTQAKDFSVDQLLEAIFALGTSDKYIEADDNLSIQLMTLNLEPPEDLTYGAVTPRMRRGISRLEQLARKTSLYGFANVVRPFDCAVVAFALSQLKRGLGRGFRQSVAFRHTKLTNFELSIGELGKRAGPKPSTILLSNVVRLLSHFEPDFTFFQPQGVQFLERLQRHMEVCVVPAQQLVVFQDKDFGEPLFAGETMRPASERVYLLHLENRHVCLIADPVSFFDGAKIWDCCLRITRNKSSHGCSKEERFCLKCGGRSCWESRPAPPDLVCAECQTFFDRYDCYLAHGTGRPPRCATHATCTRCLAICQRTEPYANDLKAHDCLVYKCRHCKGSFKASGIEPHFCVYQPPNEKALGGSEESFFRVYFDLETCVRGEQRELVPYLVCAVFVCSTCLEDFHAPESWEETYKCCGRRKRVYWFREGLRCFLRDTFQDRKDIKRGIAVAYNMRNFDGYFLLRTLIAAGASTKNVVAGNRLMSISFNGVQVKDLNL